MAGFWGVDFAAGFGLAFGIGFADHTRFNASLKGIAGASSCAGLSEGFALDMNEYYAALGRFITSMSRTERLLVELVWKEAGLHPPEAPALLYGMRVVPAMDALERLYEARDKPISTGLQNSFAQLATINTARNWVVHWGIEIPAVESPADFDGIESLMVSNAHLAHTEASVRRLPISIADLNDMAYDLGFISAVFQIQQTLDAPQANYILNHSEWRSTWRYKFPQSKASPAGSQSKLERPQRQRKASRGKSRGERQ